MMVPGHLGTIIGRPVAPDPRRRRRFVDDAPVHRGMAPRAILAIRLAGGRDADAVTLLEQMEQRTLSAGPHLVAEVDGRVVAAVAVVDGTAVGNPFEHTTAAVELLRLRARQLRIVGVPRPARRVARARIIAG